MLCSLTSCISQAPPKVTDWLTDGRTTMMIAAQLPSDAAMRQRNQRPSLERHHSSIVRPFSDTSGIAPVLVGLAACKLAKHGSSVSSPPSLLNRAISSMHTRRRGTVSLSRKRPAYTMSQRPRRRIPLPFSWRSPLPLNTSPPRRVPHRHEEHTPSGSRHHCSDALRATTILGNIRAAGAQGARNRRLLLVQKSLQSLRPERLLSLS